MLAALKSFIGGWWGGGAGESAEGGGYNNLDRFGADRAFQSGDSTPNDSFLGTHFGGPDVLREAEDNYEVRLQNTRDTNAAQQALANGQTAKAASIMERNPQVGLQIDGRELYVTSAAEFLLQPAPTAQFPAHDATAARNNLDQAALLKDSLNRQLSAAEYVFGASEHQLGRLRLDKATGEITLLQAIQDDKEEALYRRAAHKIRKHWEAGELPKETCWAS